MCMFKHSISANFMNLHVHGLLAGWSTPWVASSLLVEGMGMSHQWPFWTIHWEIGLLKKLKVLRVGDNSLTGHILEEIYKFIELRVMGFASSLNGSIPRTFGQLQQLKSLNLQDTILSGSIPVELGNCKSLEIFSAARNGLQGKIPPSLGNLSNLSELLLYSDDLSEPSLKKMGFWRSWKFLE